MPVSRADPGVFQVMPITEAMEEIILKGGSALETRTTGRAGRHYRPAARSIEQGQKRDIEFGGDESGYEGLKRRLKAQGSRRKDFKTQGQGSGTENRILGLMWRFQAGFWVAIGAVLRHRITVLEPLFRSKIRAIRGPV